MLRFLAVSRLARNPNLNFEIRSKDDERLAQTVLNSLSANIAILDRHGRIIETNRAWRAYADRNQLEGPNDSLGDSYLAICDRTDGEEAEVARQVSAGIRAVLRGEIREFVLDYPCHSPSEEHWYYLRALRMSGEGPAPSKTLSILIGDVSGHGISSALLMAAARASLRQRASTRGGLADVIGDVNRQITRDLMASGQFITLLGMQLTPRSGRLVWVRAGHEPALLYRAREDRFENLVGEGAAPLGLDAAAVFSANETAGLVPGDILVLYTDGITEARNPGGNMFGRERIEVSIRANVHQSARRIRDALLDDVKNHIAAAGGEDDVTLVVAKMV